MPTKFLYSLKHARIGLRVMFLSERNFRIHLFVAFWVIILAIWQDISKFEWLALLLVIALVLILEIVNASVERLVDMLAPKTHHFAKEIKDLLASMVLVAAILAILVAGLIFF